MTIYIFTAFGSLALGWVNFKLFMLLAHLINTIATFTWGITFENHSTHILVKLYTADGICELKDSWKLLKTDNNSIIIYDHEHRTQKN